MIFLIDHNLNGHALIFLGSIASQGWLDILPIRFITFDEIGLPITAVPAVMRYTKYSVAVCNKSVY